MTGLIKTHKSYTPISPTITKILEIFLALKEITYIRTAVTQPSYKTVKTETKSQSTQFNCEISQTMYLYYVHFKFLYVKYHDGPKKLKHVAYMKIHCCVRWHLTIHLFIHSFIQSFQWHAEGSRGGGPRVVPPPQT
jgi:hypothetical protein